MDGIFFYWFCWIFWIIISFFMPKSKSRTIFAVWILITIILSKLYISIDSMEISLAYIALFLGSFVFLAKLQNIGFHIFSAFTILVGYTSILIWESIAPVWLFMPKLLLIPILCVVVTVFITNGFYNRVAISILGLCGGELLYSIMLARFSIIQPVGDLLFLDVLLIVLFLVTCVEGIQLVRRKLFVHLTKV